MRKAILTLHFAGNNYVQHPSGQNISVTGADKSIFGEMVWSRVIDLYIHSRTVIRKCYILGTTKLVFRVKEETLFRL